MSTEWVTAFAPFHLLNCEVGAISAWMCTHARTCPWHLHCSLRYDIVLRASEAERTMMLTEKVEGVLVVMRTQGSLGTQK